MLTAPLFVAYVALAVGVANATPLVRDMNDGITLAVGPKCGPLSGNVSDVNAGLLPLKSYKTIVAFGDSYTDGGVHNGSALLPAVITGTNARAGGRFSNGPLWVEDLASDAGAKLMDYAVAGAVTDVTLWPSKAGASDFVAQSNLFTGQKNNLNPDTTLYTAFFGINDYSASLGADGNHMPQAASALIYQLNVLASAPTFAKHILVVDDYGRGSASAAGDAYKQSIFAGLNAMHKQLGVKVAYVDLKTIWNGVLHGPPGYKAFGYTSTGYCTVSSTSTVGQCADPAHTFYWINGHPSKETHRIMADYIEEVLTQCIAS